jgi:hypothetical protein
VFDAEQQLAVRQLRSRRVVARPAQKVLVVCRSVQLVFPERQRVQAARHGRHKARDGRLRKQSLREHRSPFSFSTVGNPTAG